MGDEKDFVRATRVLAVLAAAGVASGVIAVLDPTAIRPGAWEVAFTTDLVVASLLAMLLAAWGSRLSERRLFVVLQVLATLPLVAIMANQSRVVGLLDLTLLVPAALWAALWLGPRLARLHVTISMIGAAVVIELVVADPMVWASLVVLPLIAVVSTCEVVLALRRTMRTTLDELNRASRHDPLTGLLNRRGLDEAAADARRPTGAVLVLDIDHFKAVNDTHGHGAGDDALRRLSTAITRSFPHHPVARTGGEEFLVLCTADTRADLHQAAEHLRSAANQALEPWACTVSIGAGRAEPGIGSTVIEDLTAAADAALYLAKSDGRNRVVLAEDVHAP